MSRFPRLDLDLTIGIVTWNSNADIATCLRALAAAGGTLRWQVTVVDNASTDGTVRIIETHFPGLRLIRNSRNRGFGAAHNQAMQEGVGRRHLILNPDTIAQEGSLQALVEYQDAHSEAGLVGPQILEKDGSVYPSCRSFPTAGALLFRNKLLSRLFPKNPYTRGYLMQDLDHQKPTGAGWLSGSAILISRSALEEIGPLDERFFMYCEDMDWCRRAHDLGWEVIYYPVSRIVHLGHRSTDQRIPAMILMHHLSMWKYYRKHEAAKHGPPWSAGLALVLGLRASLLVSHYFLRKLLGRL